MARARFDAAALAIVRAAYARQLFAFVGADARLERAFAQTPREAFLGPGPWLLKRGPYEGYAPVPADPVLAYQDALIALKPDKGINNGQPSLHAHWLRAAHIRSGEHVVHIGAGAGYYTAILSRLVGARGRVTAVEFDPDLAAAAAHHLAGYGNVTVVNGDGAAYPHAPADLVYVNFAVDRPAAPWLERLKPGGRLVFPLGTIARTPESRTHGAGLCVTATGKPGVFAVRWLNYALFIRASGDSGLLAEAAEREALLRAFEQGMQPKSLRWRAPAGADALFAGEGWSLGADAP